jgi:ubiquinone/menaquinone biosynthesis C-methylase UbiE
MSTADQYVNLRVRRLKPGDLKRTPNKWLASLPQYRGADRVLDIACGMGYDSLAWARQGKRPVAIDYNWGLVKNAAELASQEGLKIDFVVADATRLPFREGAFDFCFSENLFEHVPSWQGIVSEANRVLRTDGVFFVRTTNRHCPLNPEINHMHFYPWLPNFFKRPILRWIQRKRPAWINYSQFPAVNWFTHRGLSEAFKKRGFSTYEMFDLVRRDLLPPKKQKLGAFFDALKNFRPLRYLVYPLIRSVQVVGVKKASTSESTS